MYDAVWARVETWTDAGSGPNGGGGRVGEGAICASGGSRRQAIDANDMDAEECDVLAKGNAKGIDAIEANDEAASACAGATSAVL